MDLWCLQAVALEAGHSGMAQYAKNSARGEVYNSYIVLNFFNRRNIDKISVKRFSVGILLLMVV